MGIHWRSTGATISPRAHRTSAKIQILVLGSMLLFSISRSSLGADKGVISVDGSELLGGASKILVDSGQNLVSLAKAGQGLKLQGVPAGGTLAIRYASAEVGTISVAVNGGPACKVNVHSSGDATNSFLNAKIQMAVPEGAMVTISRGEGDVAVNIQQITVGEGELGLPPDIWNLPELKVASEPYPADWKGLAARYATPEWWRDAKFGASAHWDPQSMPEQGDWYARGMYQEGSTNTTIRSSTSAIRRNTVTRTSRTTGSSTNGSPKNLWICTKRWGPNTSWPWGRIMTILTAGIRRTSRGIPRTLAQRWTSSARGRR